MKEINEQLTCSFCGKPKEMVERLLAGPNGIFICNECIEACADVLKEDNRKDAEKRHRHDIRKKYNKNI